MTTLNLTKKKSLHCMIDVSIIVTFVIEAVIVTGHFTGWPGALGVQRGTKKAAVNRFKACAHTSVLLTIE